MPKIDLFGNKSYEVIKKPQEEEFSRIIEEILSKIADYKRNNYGL